MELRRKTTSYVVIATLLLCPYACLVRAAAVADTGDCACDCPDDDCCPALPVSDFGGDQPTAPDSNRQAGTCLCHGTVLESPTILPGLDAGLAAFVAVSDLADMTKSSVSADGLFAAEHPACHFPAADSGREVRALIESLLL